MTSVKALNPVFLALFTAVVTVSLFADIDDYPLIRSLSSKDMIYRQAVNDINLSYTHNSSGDTGNIPLVIYRYKPEKNENLFMIASRLNLPYEAVSTLNKIPSIQAFDDSGFLLIPNQPVLFIPSSPESDLDYLLSSREYDRNKTISIKKAAGQSEYFFYIINGRFNNTERAFFLDTFFRFPLEKGRITSYFGHRLSPITGKNSFHTGIDIAAPSGTPVFAAGNGKVTALNSNEVLGNYIIISHPGNYRTLYGHLKKTYVILGETVNSGRIIGEVGNTGYSTGPHLHFEVRTGEKASDPMIILDRKR